MGMRTIKRTLDKYCKCLGVAPSSYPIPDDGLSQRDGIYYTNEPRYSFSVKERGKTINKIECSTEQELYYGILKLLSFEIAMRAEAKHRRCGEDPRRQIFAIQLQYMESLAPEFGEMLHKDITELLKKCPYQDCSF